MGKRALLASTHHIITFCRRGLSCTSNLLKRYICILEFPPVGPFCLGLTAVLVMSWQQTVSEHSYREVNLISNTQHSGRMAKSIQLLKNWIDAVAEICERLRPTRSIK
jgi:hypothetical protein